MELFLEYLASFLPIIIFIIYLATFNKYKEHKPYKLFCLYIGFIVAVQTISAVLYYFRENNLLFSHIYFIGEFLFLSLFLRNLLLDSQKKKADALIIIVALILVILIGLNFLGYFELSPFHPLEILLCATPIMIFAVTHLFNSLNNALKFIYITIGAIIYKTISVLAFMLQNFVNSDIGFDILSDILWNLNSAFLVVYYGLMFIEWYKNYRHKKVG